MSISLATDGYYGGDISAVGLAPVITPISPVPGASPGDPGGFAASFTLAAQTPIVIDVTEAFPGVSYINVLIDGFLAYRNAWVAEYIAESFVTSVTDGTELHILPAGGWHPSGPATSTSYITVQVDAIDLGGGLSSTTFVYELPAQSTAISPPAPAVAPLPTAADILAEADSLIVSQFRGDDL